MPNISQFPFFFRSLFENKSVVPNPSMLRFFQMHARSLFIIIIHSPYVSFTLPITLIGTLCLVSFFTPWNQSISRLLQTKNKNIILWLIHSFVRKVIATWWCQVTIPKITELQPLEPFRTSFLINLVFLNYLFFVYTFSLLSLSFSLFRTSIMDRSGVYVCMSIYVYIWKLLFL